MSTWNLDVLYEGYDSPNFKHDFNYLSNLIESLVDLSEKLTAPISIEQCHIILKKMQEFTLLTRKVGTYISLNSSTNTTDATTVAYRGQFSTIASNSTKPITALNKLLCSIDLDDYSNKDSFIKEHYFILSELQAKAKHQLSDEVEEAISKMSINASDAWDNLHEYLTSILEVDYNGEKMTLPSIRNLAYSSDPKVRKDAFEAEITAYDKINDAIAFALNSIKGEANTVAKLRGYDSVLDMTLVQSRMKKETLEAMLSAMKKYLPEFHRYLRHKATLFGHTNGLPFYDLFATLKCENSSTFTIEEAKDYLVKNFDSFSSEVSEIVHRAYDEHWIDFYPRKGKVGGAFCANIPFLKQSRVLTNFDGSLSDVVTLAHELGHAYHGACIQDHSILNTKYTMPVAETASTFNETIIMNAAIRDAKSSEERAMLIESMLQDVTQVICDIYSRYLFESEVVDRRKSQFLFSSDLEEIMLNAQKTAYGNGLDHSKLHPYMWVNKGHYYNANLNFYNFPYAFGCLFAKGLYAQFIKEGPSFVTKYNQLLNATTVNSCEDVAKMANIDITKEDFWISSLEIIKEYIDQFIELTSN